MHQLVEAPQAGEQSISATVQTSTRILRRPVESLNLRLPTTPLRVQFRLVSSSLSSQIFFAKYHNSDGIRLRRHHANAIRIAGAAGISPRRRLHFQIVFDESRGLCALERSGSAMKARMHRGHLQLQIRDLWSVPWQLGRHAFNVAHASPPLGYRLLRSILSPGSLRTHPCPRLASWYA